MSKISRLTLFFFLTLPSQSGLAWDSSGHRLSAAVAMNFLSDSRQNQLLEILSHHPRYDEDFLQRMPAFVGRGSNREQTEWLLGQAAYWPDMARGFPEEDRRRYNRPTWHYTDGAWVRDGTPSQGNYYIGIDTFPAIQGEFGDTISSEEQVHNIVTALDYNTRLLADENIAGADRAIALCWVLHLMADIHQPLHTGSLYSSQLFDDGDAGGNGIATIYQGDERNLHSRWDRAVRGFGVTENLDLVMVQLTRPSGPRIEGVESDWNQWLEESRQILTSDTVYTPKMRTAILEADRSGQDLPGFSLNQQYMAQMQEISRQRLGLAGLRLAIWFENELP